MSSPVPAQAAPSEIPADSRAFAQESGGHAAKLDLSRVAPPRNLDTFELEEITIDGICGVY